MCLERNEKNWLTTGFFTLLISILSLLVYMGKWTQAMEDGLANKVNAVDVVYYQTLVKQNHEKLSSSGQFTYEMYVADKLDRRAENIEISKELKAIRATLNLMNINLLTHKHDRTKYSTP